MPRSTKRFAVLLLGSYTLLGLACGGIMTTWGCKALSDETRVTPVTTTDADQTATATGGSVNQDASSTSNTVTTVGDTKSLLIAFVVLSVLSFLGQIGGTIVICVLVWHFRYQREKAKWLSGTGCLTPTIGTGSP